MSPTFGSFNDNDGFDHEMAEAERRNKSKAKAPMTARPMTEGERARTLDHARFIAGDDLAAMTATGPEVERLAVLLLSTSSEVRRLREALEFYADPRRYNGPNQYNPGDDPHSPQHAAYLTDVTRDNGGRAYAALSGEGEDELATRSQGLATAPTDRLQDKESSK